MESIGYRLAITLTTPAIIDPLTTLDSLFSAAVYQRTGDVEAAKFDLPLARRDGCWCASSVEFGRGFWWTSTFIAQFARDDWRPDRYTTRDRKGRPKFLVGGGDYVPRLDFRRAWAGVLYFEAVGSIDAGVRLIEELPGIGAKTTHGFGEVASIDVEEIDTDGLQRDGKPLRPIPTALWSAWGYPLDDDIAVDMTTWSAPYWSRSRELCVLRST